MKWQIEQLDLLQPWPVIGLREDAYAMRILVRLGNAPVGEVRMRPARGRVVDHDRLKRRLVRELGDAICKRILAAWINAGSPVRTTNLKDASELLDPAGLSEPMHGWVSLSQSSHTWPTPAVTIAVASRDDADALNTCIARLLHLDYPDFEILVIDASQDPVPAREIADRCGIGYVRCPASRDARKVAIIKAHHEWVAFLDDQSRPETNWLKELVRPLQDVRCRAVIGPSLPTSLDNAAERVMNDHLSLPVWPQDKLFDASASPADVFKLAGATNLLLHRNLARRLGGAGAMPLYDLLRRGNTIQYAPRAIVHHTRRLTAKSLRRHVRATASARSAFLARCALARRDRRALVELLWQTPKSLTANLWYAISGRPGYPFSLALLEIRPSLTGPFIQATAGLLRRLAQPRSIESPPPAPTPQPPLAPTKLERPPDSPNKRIFEAFSRRKPPRAA